MEVIYGLHQVSVAEHGALVKQFHHITDQRTSRGGHYPLPFILVVIVMSNLSDQNRPSDIAEWLELTLERRLANSNGVKAEADSVVWSQPVPGPVAASSRQVR